MPVYEFQCKKCKKKFEITMTFSEKEENHEIVCPKCESTETERIYEPYVFNFKR